MNNNIRIGKISAIDYASGLVRVVYHDKDDAVTGLIPLLSSEYFMPQVGDQVIVLDLYRKELSHENGKAYIRYEGGVLKIHADSIVLNGNVTVTGSLTSNE